MAVSVFSSFITAITFTWLILSVIGQSTDVKWNDEGSPNRVFPPLPSGILRSRTAIAPWSKYQQKLKNDQQLASRRYSKPSEQKISLLKSPAPQSNSITANTMDSSIPVIITLEPFKTYQAKKVTSEDDKKEIFYSSLKQEGEKPLKHTHFSTNDHQAIPRPEKAMYSTAADRHPISPITRQKNIIISGRSGSGISSQARTSQHRDYLHQANMIPKPAVNEYTLQSPRYTVIQKTPTQIRGVNTFQLPINAASNAMRALPQYSRLIPAPSLPISPESTNIANSIFAQSQIRQPPIPAISNDITNAGNNLASFLSSEHVVEDISKIARNLLSLPGPNQQELFSALTSAITNNKPLLPATNVVGESSVIQPSNILNAKELFSSLAEKEVAQNSTNTTEADIEKALKNLPEEGRALLQAAIQSGELESGSVLTAINDSSDSNKLSRQNENRLIEWIQQNRPRPSKAKHPVPIPSDKLPYYGKYCGSFVEQANSKKHYNVAGAVWAVDDHRFIISKFHFVPGSLLNENVTFWAGPANISGDAATDMTPSVNGFYLQPEPIDIMTFLTKQIKKIDAKLRVNKEKTTEASVKETNNSNDGKTMNRRKRDHFTDVYEEPMYSFMQELPSENNSAEQINATIRLVVKDGVLETANYPSLYENGNNAVKEEFKNTEDDRMSATTVSSVTTTSTNSDRLAATTTAITPLMITEAIKTATAVLTKTATETTVTKKESTTSALSLSTESQTMSAKTMVTKVITPLGWYAGFQPLLLTLPDNKWLKSVYWLALRDHDRDHTIASVLIPNGPAFKIPAIVQLRPLTSNGVCTVTSGPIKVLDTKTIEISELTFKCDGVGAWFMIGKDILPNENGQIVPIYNRQTNEFDCDSLPQYENQTVTLRLPGMHDIKDVFWFSIFSIKQSVSLSHIYLPYNDMQLPPDLNGIATPECIWRSA